MKKLMQKSLQQTQCKTGLQSHFCVVMGLQWGHEGKSKLLNKLTPDYDYSCRYNGGTVTEPVHLNGEDTLSILPHGVQFETGTKSLLGNGVVIDPNTLLADLKTLSKNGIGYRDRLIISDRSNLVTNLHKRIAEKLSGIRNDSLWLCGEDVTQSFKPIKMALRMGRLVEDWNEFEDKY